MAKADKLPVDVPQQGISLSLSPDEAVAFLDAEQAYYSKHANLFDNQVSILGANLGQSGSRYNDELNRTKIQLKSNDASGFANYIKLAQQCRPSKSFGDNLFRISRE